MKLELPDGYDTDHFSLDNFWVFPFPANPTLNFTLIYQPNHAETIQLLFGAFNDSTPPLRAERTDVPNERIFTLFFHDNEIGQIRYFNETDCVVSFVAVDDYSLEVIAVKENTVLIPQLQKSKGDPVKNLMVSFKEQDSSILFSSFTRSSPKVQQFVLKVPKNQDYSFDGHFKSKSPMNMILYHTSKEDRSILTLEEVSMNTFTVILAYPFNPIQAFCLAISHLFADI